MQLFPNMTLCLMAWWRISYMLPFLCRHMKYDYMLAKMWYCIEIQEFIDLELAASPQDGKNKQKIARLSSDFDGVMIIAAWGGDTVSQTDQLKPSYLDFAQEQELCANDNLRNVLQYCVIWWILLQSKITRPKITSLRPRHSVPENLKIKLKNSYCILKL